MAGVNSTTTCFDDASLQQCSLSIMCPHESMASFHKTMGGTLWQVNMMVLTDAVLAGVTVAIGAFAQRYRHHPFTRFIFLGATTLLLPITSFVVSTISTNTNDYVNKNNPNLVASCRGGFHYFTAVSWAFLIQITMINTSIIVAVDDREGENRGPPIELVVQGIWTIYLGVYAMGPIANNVWQLYLELMLFAIVCAKLLLTYFAFLKSRKSYAFGRNPRLVYWYMAQRQRQEAIQPIGPLVGEDKPPPLLVMGEGNSMVMGPHGYFVNTNGLVTVDMVWQLNDDVFQPMQQLRDMCLSFSLFKLLRCRFAQYENADYTSMETLNYFWNFLLLRDENHERVFRVIADELSFVQDYYFSSLPVSYSKYWLPILSISISLLSIAYCVLATSFIMMGLLKNWNTKYIHQLRCHFWCNNGRVISNRQDQNFGSFLFDDISLFLLITLVVIAEVKYIASYICSNWTKLALVCHHINHAASKHSSCMRKCFSFLLKRKWGERITKHWDEKMDQNSILVVHPRTVPLVRRLLRLPDLDRSVNIPDAVKVSIFDTLRRYRQQHWHRLGNGTESLRRSPVRNKFLLFCSTNSTSDTILTWHIATCILELYHHGQGQPDSDHKVTATHISRYCTYLMAWSPDLLPDDDKWSKSLYRAVKKDAKRALVEFNVLALESEYEQVVRLLRDNLEHDEDLRNGVPSKVILWNGVRLAEQLMELTECETCWMVLAEFWSEMILYIAPSKNVRGHLGAVARGGELITFLWALLTHAGIVSWPADG